ncbi:hypothetical protein Abiwalacus_06200 [Akkermansia biwaensis]|jgi:hypothetical protein|uniref:Uncharacterized protein n=1 Tax=Akkermansia biwaensis TaxID=2946555 RepID=A0ABN6QES5_9BACT|nr:hypothetical protein Abiwalacus_06200 [Akkermansia biwaensis]
MAGDANLRPGWGPRIFTFAQPDITIEKRARVCPPETNKANYAKWESAEFIVSSERETEHEQNKYHMPRR